MKKEKDEIFADDSPDAHSCFKRKRVQGSF